MSLFRHSLLVGDDLHVPGYRVATDPGAVGAGMLWEDTDTGTLRKRNLTNTGWVSLGGSSQLFYVVTDYGATGDGSTNDTAAIQAAINAAIAAGGGEVLFPGPGPYLVSSTLRVTSVPITFRGVTATTANFVNLYYTGTGAAFEIGADDGLPYDSGLYNGVQGVQFHNLQLRYTGSATTALLNGLGTYGTGTYGIRDWRGGGVLLFQTRITKFAYGFWGIESDFAHFDNAGFNDNSCAMYFGPRSDQALVNHCLTYRNDRVFLFDGATGARVVDWTTDSDGSATTNPVRLQTFAASFRTTNGIVFERPWLENLVGHALTMEVEAFFETGISESNRQGALSILHPTILVNPYTTANLPHTLFLVKADTADAVVVDSPTEQSGHPYTNLRAIFKITGVSGACPELYFRDVLAKTMRLVENTSSAEARLHVDPTSTGVYTNNVVGGTTVVTPYPIVVNGPAATHRQVQFQTDGVARWILRANNTAEGGANAGSDLSLTSRTDAGAVIAEVLLITRSSGDALWQGHVGVAAGKGFKVNGIQVAGTQGAAVADATGAGDVVAQLNSLLARLRTHGLIAT